VRTLLQPLPLLATEDKALYEALVAELRATLNPSDIIEEIWFWDVVHNQWEIGRLARSKVGLVNAARQEALEKILERLIEPAATSIRVIDLRFDDKPKPSKAQDLAWRCTKRDKDAKKEVEQLLATADLDWDVILAQAMALHIDAIERFDRMIKQAEGRRDVVVRQIDAHRAALGRAPLGKIQEVEDAEFRVIERDVEADKGRF
jgi:hypothetical protein